MSGPTIGTTGGIDLDEWAKAHTPPAAPEDRPMLPGSVRGSRLICLTTRVLPALPPIVWLSLMLAGRVASPLGFFLGRPSGCLVRDMLDPGKGLVWLLLTLLAVALLSDGPPRLLRRLGWMPDEPKTPKASLESIAERHYGVTDLKIDWFGVASDGPFDGLFSASWRMGRHAVHGVLRVQDRRIWLYGPDGTEQERTRPWAGR